MAIAAAMTLALLAGCNSAGDEPGDGQSTTGSGPTVTSPTTDAPDPAALARLRALAAYEGMWAAYDNAGRAPAVGLDDERLAEHADGRALQVLTDGLRSLRDRGLVIDGRVELHPEVVELSPATEPTLARVGDCGDSSDWLTVDALTGEVTDEPRGRQLVFATVADVGGGLWKVVDFAVRGVGSCG